MNLLTYLLTIVEYLKAIDVDVISCYLVSSKSESKFVTMRLCVSHANANKLFNSDIWPVGVVIRLWTFKSREQN